MESDPTVFSRRITANPLALAIWKASLSKASRNEQSVEVARQSRRAARAIGEREGFWKKGSYRIIACVQICEIPEQGLRYWDYLLSACLACGESDFTVLGVHICPSK
jgi:hypothetical protein